MGFNKRGFIIKYKKVGKQVVVWLLSWLGGGLPIQAHGTLIKDVFGFITIIVLTECGSHLSQNFEILVCCVLDLFCSASSSPGIFFLALQIEY